MVVEDKVLLVEVIVVGGRVVSTGSGSTGMPIKLDFTYFISGYFPENILTYMSFVLNNLGFSI